MKTQGGHALGAAIAILCWLVAPAMAEPLTFEGRVEAYKRAELSSRLNGVVAEILFSGGERVTAGTPMIRLDAEDLELSIAAAEAEVSRTEAAHFLARREAERVRTLGTRGVVTEVRADQTESSLKQTAAELEAARVALKRAQLDLRHATIRAPIDGFAGRPLKALGAYVEAEAGPPLGEIIQIDPALIAYRVPYAVRLETLEKTGVETIEALFRNISLTVLLPGGQAYPQQGKPDFASASIDPSDGSLTVWTSVPNPNAILRPGMAVTVLSDIAVPKDASTGDASTGDASPRNASQ